MSDFLIIKVPWSDVRYSKVNNSHLFHLIAYRPASSISDVSSFVLPVIQLFLKKPKRDLTSRIVVIILMKVLNFGSNILAGKFPVSGIFLRHRCVHVQLMCPYFLASVPLASKPSTALIRSRFRKIFDSHLQNYTGKLKMITWN